MRVVTFAVWLAFVLLIAVLVIESRSGWEPWLPFSFAAAVMLLALLLIARRRSLFRAIAAGDTNLRSRSTLTIEEGGLRFRRPSGEVFVAWNGIRSVEELDGLILVYLDGTSFMPIPASAFSNSAERAELLAEIRGRTATLESSKNLGQRTRSNRYAKFRWPAAILLSGILGALTLAMIAREWELQRTTDDEEVDNDDQEPLTPTSEEVFYLQPSLLEQQLAALKPGRRGVIDLYFIGVAAYGEQDVFMKEVQSVRKLFDERFDTAGRSLMLINNPATVRKLPIASLTSLGLALQRVAEVMDRDEDILFLFITSHGSTDEGLAFEFSPMQLDPLDPKRLKDLLDEFGFQRRVVVVSACYSGGFVDALRDDSTLVIAASAPDKNSFGCSNDADFTYFGKAYFDEALRQTYSFSEAFELARPMIAERERKEKFVPSEPRMFVGEHIKRALDKFVRLRQSAVKRSSLDVHP
jgi:hypothetical protein